MRKLKKICGVILGAAILLQSAQTMAKDTSLVSFANTSGAAAPYITDSGMAMLPVRFFIKSLHIPADYDGRTGSVTLSSAGVRVTVNAGSSIMEINGVQSELPCEVQNRDGYVFVPARAVCEALGYEVEWLADMNCINIKASENRQPKIVGVTFEAADAAAKAGKSEIGSIIFEPVESSTDYIGERDKHVMAFIMGNERTDVYSGTYRCWNNQSRDGSHNPNNMYPDGKRDIAGIYYPSIGLYDATDPDYMEYRFQLMKMTYIDTASFYTIPSDNFKNVIKSTLVPLMDKYDMTACLRLSSSNYNSLGTEEEWNKIFFDEINEYIGLFGERNLKIDNRPVVTVFDSAGLSPDSIRAWKSSYPEGEEPFVMRWLINSFGPELKGAYDGMYDWVSTDGNKNGYVFPKQVAPFSYYTNVDFAKYHHILDLKNANRLLEAKASADYYAASVSPGFDSTAVWGWGTTPTKVERGENGELYEFKWQHAAEGKYPMVGIPTWDDWGEGSGIEPTVEYGNKYLEITREYAAKYLGITPNDGNLNLPDRIYKIRKTVDDTQTLADMEKACTLIAQEKYAEAEAIVKPYAEAMNICDVNTVFNYPATAAKSIDFPKEDEPPKDGTVGIVNDNGSVTYYPVEDSYIRDGSASKSNFAASTALAIKNSTPGMNRKSYIKFDIRDNKKKNFTKATLRLYVSQIGSQSRIIMYYDTSNDWDEQTITWTNAPQEQEAFGIIDTPVSIDKKWVEVDVTELVKNHPDGVISIVLANVGEIGEKNNMTFASRELNGKEPQLVLE